MELLKTFRRKSFFSELVYIALNIGLAIAVLIIVRTVVSPLPALLLILLSKWRVFAVRPRYWFAHIQANLVDVTVSASIVILMYSVGSMSFGLLLQVIIALLYVAWLVVLKPRSSRRAIVAQATTALLAGTAALFVSSYGWPIELVVAGMALVGYVTARHVLTQYEEDHLQFLSILWAFITAQLTWILAHWVIAYTIPGIDLRVPQAVIIMGLLSFIVYKVYASYKRHGEVRSVDVMMPAIFSTGMIFALMVFFSAIPVGTL